MVWSEYDLTIAQRGMVSSDVKGNMALITGDIKRKGRENGQKNPW